MQTKLVMGLVLLPGLWATAAFADPGGSPAQKRAERATPVRTDRFGDPLPPGAVARVGTVRWWHGSDMVLPIHYAPDGKSLVFRDDKGIVYFLDAATGAEIRRIQVPGEGGAAAFALAPDGKFAATADAGRSHIRIWEVRTGKELRRIEGDERNIAALAFSPDGKTLAAGAHTDIRLWDTADWKEKRSLAGKDVKAYELAFLPDGKTLIVSEHRGITWWDLAAGREVRRIDVAKYGKDGNAFSQLTISPDGKRLAALHYQHPSATLLLWNAATGEEVRRIDLEPKYRFRCLAFSPDSQTLACRNSYVFWGNRTVFFSAAKGKELYHWDNDDPSTGAIAYSPDGKTLAELQPPILRLREARMGKPAVPYRGLSNLCMAVRFGRDGKSLLTGCLDGQTGAWDPLTGEPLTPLRAPPRTIGPRSQGFVQLSLTSRGEKVALVNAEGVLNVWESATGKMCCRIAEPPVSENPAVFSADGKVVAVKHTDKEIRLWDAGSGKLLTSLRKTADGAFDPSTPHPHAFSPDGRVLAAPHYAANATTLRLYDTDQGRQIGQIPCGDDSSVESILFSPEGKYLIATHIKYPNPERSVAIWETSVRVWDRVSGREKHRFRLPPLGGAQPLAIAPDGKTLAIAIDKTIFLWELAGGVKRGRFTTDHRKSIGSLAFSPDGRLLASGSLDHTACVWDVTGLCPDGQWPPHHGKQDELERLWSDLGHRDGVRAYRALWRLAAAAPDAIPFLKSRLRPVPRVSDERLARLLAELDSDQFETRERASADFRRLGEQGKDALRKALAAKPSLEMRFRLRALLDELDKATPSAEQLRALRAVEVLEYAGTTEARVVLRSLTEGAPGAWLTREARAALHRLSP